LASQEAIPS